MTQQELKEHELRERAVMQFFTDITEEVKTIFFTPDCEKIVSIRIQTITAFVFAEVLSNYWDCYTKQNRAPTARLTDWINIFCGTDENSTYQTIHHFQTLGAEPLLELRHSLIHFFGLSRQKEGKQITLGSSDMDDEVFKKFEKGFTSGVAVLKPIHFYQLFRDGALLMMNKMLTNVRLSVTDESKKQEHINGISRIFDKFQAEGAMQVVIPKFTTHV